MRRTAKPVLVPVLIFAFPVLAMANEGKALRDAASEGDREAVARELDSGVDVDAASESGATALMYAAYGDHAAVVTDLLEAGADADHGDRFGDPAINWAAYGGAAAAVDELLAGGADPTIVTHHGDALAIAMRRGFPEIVESLVRNTEIPTGDTSLHIAARAGQLEEIERRLAAGDEIDAGNRIGYTPLMEAAREGHAEVVAHLLAAGADPTHRGNALGMGMSALHLAADRDRAEIARLLLSAGIAVDGGNATGSTPLIWALGEGSLETAGVLLDAGANPSLEDEHGYSALDMLDYVDDPDLRARIIAAAE